MAIAVDKNTLLVCLLLVPAYFLCGSGIIIVNKVVMSPTKSGGYGFPYPILLAAIGNIASVLTVECGLSIASFLGFKSRTQGWNFFSCNRFKAMLSLLPMGLFSGATLALGNSCYLYLDVSSVTVLKAFGPVIAFFVSVLLLSSCAKIDKLTLTWVFVISLGTLCGTWAMPHLHPLGLTFQVSAMLCECLRLVLTEKFVSHDEGSKNLSAFEQLGLTASITSLFLMVLVSIFEREGVKKMFSILFHKELFAVGEQITHPKLVIPQAAIFHVCALLGVAVCFLNTTLIKYTSAVSFKVLACLRNGGIFVISIAVLREKFSGLEVFGFLIALFGFIMYVRRRATVMQKQRAEEQLKSQRRREEEHKYMKSEEFYPEEVIFVPTADEDTEGFASLRASSSDVSVDPDEMLYSKLIAKDLKKKKRTCFGR